MGPVLPTMGKAQPKQSAIAAFGLQLLGGPELSEAASSERRLAPTVDLSAPGRNGSSEVAEQQEAADVVRTQPAEQQRGVTGSLLQSQGVVAAAPNLGETALAKARADVAVARLAELDAQRLLDSASPQRQQRQVAAALPAEHVPGVLHKQRMQSSLEQPVQPQPLPLPPVDGRVIAPPRSVIRSDAAAGGSPVTAATVKAPANMKSQLPVRASERPTTTQHVSPDASRQEGAVSSAAAQSTRSAASGPPGSAADAASVLSGRGAPASPVASVRHPAPPAVAAIADGQGSGGRSTRTQQQRQGPNTPAAAAVAPALNSSGSAAPARAMQHDHKVHVESTRPAPGGAAPTQDSALSAKEPSRAPNPIVSAAAASPAGRVRPLDAAQITAHASAGAATPAIIDTGAQTCCHRRL